MKSDIIIIGGGASGLMAAFWAGKTASELGKDLQITVLEKMPRPARKIMITGKGRCNFTNNKDWNDFSGHVRTNPNLIKSAFYSLPSQKVIDFFESYGMKTVVERGDRAFPASYHASDVVDTLVSAALSYGVKIEVEAEVASVSHKDDIFTVTTSDGRLWTCKRLVVASGGLSYQGTGSTGDGFRWAEAMGHKVEQLFPSLTALVPRDYKFEGEMDYTPIHKCHIHREAPLSKLGEALCGTSMKNVQLTLLVEGSQAQTEFGDIDFTDGGIEGPIGFQISRKAVKAMVNGSRVALDIDMKPGIPYAELLDRVRELWKEVDRDPRSARLHEKEKCRILLGKLMPWEMIPAFRYMNPGIMTLERKSRTETKVWVNLQTIAAALKKWHFEIAGFVGWERAVVTAGGVSASDIVPKTLESRVVPGLYFCGEVLDIDSDTGGYNLQTAFSTGCLAGSSAAKSL